MRKLNPFLKIIILLVGYFIIVFGFRFIFLNLCHIEKDIVRILIVILNVIYLFTMMRINHLESMLNFTSKSFLKGLGVGLAMILFSTFLAFIYLEDVDTSKVSSISHIYYWIIVYLISAGFVEEVITRGFIINWVKEKFPFTNKNNVIITCMISGIIFGLMHIMNIASTGQFPLGQILQTIGMGLIFSAVYVRSKCLWSTILIHAYWDVMVGLEFIFFMGDKSTSEKTLLYQLVFGSIVLGVYILLFLFLLRKNKIEECYEK